MDRPIPSGFPISGALSHELVFPISPKRLAVTINPESLFAEATARFADRPSRSSMRGVIPLWGEALAQVTKAWLARPELATDAGRIARAPGGPANLGFRFGAHQLDKMRASDDLKDARTNSARPTDTPNSLPERGHIAQLSMRGANSRSNWEFMREARAPANKWLPLQPERARFATAIPRSPAVQRRYSFKPRALMFGPTASVLHYTCLSRIIASLSFRLLGIPMVGYIDDIGEPCRLELLDEAHVAFRTLCKAIGVSLKPEKADAGNTIAFLGLRGGFPSATNGGRLKISLPSDKAGKWATLNDETIKKGQRPTRFARKAHWGEISFSQTALFGQFARAMIIPLYHKLHAKTYPSFINIRENGSSSGWPTHTAR